MGVEEESLHGGGVGLGRCYSKSFEFLAAADYCESRTQYVQSKGFRIINVVKGYVFLSVLN